MAAGGRWGLDAKNSGVYVLPPREKADENLNVYRGTAEDVYKRQIPAFIEVVFVPPASGKFAGIFHSLFTVCLLYTSH